MKTVDSYFQVPDILRRAEEGKSPVCSERKKEEQILSPRKPRNESLKIVEKLNFTESSKW